MPLPKVTHRVCPTCHIDKSYKEFNKTAKKCRVCVAAGIKSPRGERTGPKPHGVVKCARCGEMKVFWAKGFCRACWQRDRLEKKTADPNFYHTVTEKYCKKCNTTKPASDFQKNKNRPDGLQAYCRDCNSEQVRLYRQDERWAEEQRVQRRKQYAELPPEKKEKRAQRNYERQKIRLKIDPEYRNRKYRQSDLKNRRREKILWAMEDHYTIEEWLELCKKYDNRCLACKQQTKLTVDHVIPLSQGGADTIDNIQPLCTSCNSRKNDRHIDYR